MNPETKLDTSSIQALHDKYMFPCVSNYYEDPLPLAHGKGMYLTDLDGTDYLDFFGGILTVSVGHCNEHVNASLHRQIDTLQHTSTLYPTAPMVNLAKKLADITPGDLEKCFFACSVIAKPEIADHFGGLSISTFGGNPVTASAALATLEYMEEKDLPSNAKIQGDRLRSGLEALQEKHQSIGDVRGMGLMQALEIVDPNYSDGKDPDAEKMRLMLDKTKDLGLLVGKGGLYANVIRISPPMIADASDVDRALDILDQAFAAVG